MKIITKNKQAYSDYEILDTYETGIVLQWHEVKSLKNSHVNIKDAIVTISDKKLTINNMDIQLYEKANINMIKKFDPKGKRTLLVNKKELAKIVAKTTKTGLAIVPLQVYLSQRGLVKVTIGIGKLKRKYEKREDIKKRDLERETKRDLKDMGK